MCTNDRVAIEMVIALDELVLDELAQCFRLRALNHASEDSDTVWDEYGVTQILRRWPLHPQATYDLLQYHRAHRNYSSQLGHI